MDTSEIRALLQAFQDGYTQRDPEKLDEFMQLFWQNPQVELIGTSATIMGKEEWCLGLNSVRETIEGDWRYWGDVKLDVDGATIQRIDQVAWLSAAGVVSQKIPRREGYQNYVNYMQSVLEDEFSVPEAKVFDILRGAANTVFELERGETFHWPLRFTAVVVQSDGAWRFRHMQFSFATTRFPDVRWLKHD